MLSPVPAEITVPCDSGAAPGADDVAGVLVPAGVTVLAGAPTTPTASPGLATLGSRTG